MAKKLKKFLKKAGKAAAVAAALYGATKLGRKRATDVPGDAFAKAKRAMTQDTPYPDAITRAQKLTEPKPTKVLDPHQYRYPMGNWGAKGGGIAKGGMGAAFKKGGHVKSMGIAKRGGGVAKR